MDTIELMNKFLGGMCVIMLLMICSLPMWGLATNLGKTQVVGYVVNVEQASFPYPHTAVQFTIEHPTSITEVSYFMRTYYGYHEYELHQRIRITADKHLFEWYPRIIEVEVLE